MRFWPFAKKEEHAIDKRALWGAGQDIGDPVHAGMMVSQDNALRLTTVYRCVRLISESIAAMPVDAFRRTGDVRQEVPRPPRWMEAPNPETNWFEFCERVVESMAMDGNAFVLITARDAMGFPAEVWTLHPREIEVRRDGKEVRRDGKAHFLWSGAGKQQTLSRFSPTNPMGDVLHIRLATAGNLRGMSPLAQARQAIGLGLVAEKFGGRFFGSGQQLSGVIELPTADSARSREHIELMRETWKDAHEGSERSHRPGILTGGATWKAMSIPPDEAQFLETRKFQVEEICRLYGVPPHMVSSVDKSTSWGTGIEEQSIGFVRFTLLPWLVRVETAFSSLLPRGQYLKFNQRHLLRAKAQEEAETLAKYLNNGVVNFDYVREMLELAPRPGGSRYMVPSNMALIGPDGAVQPAAGPQEPPQEDRDEQAEA